MKKIYLLIATIASFSAQSQLLFEDNFSTYNSNTQLSGQGNWTNNSSTYGGGSCAGLGCTNTPVVDASLSYPNYGAAVKAISVKPSQDAVGTPLATALAMPSGGNVIYYSFLVNVASVPTSTPADFFRALSGGSFNTAIRMQIKNATGGFTVGVSKNTGTNTFTSNIYSLNTTHLIVLKYTMNNSTTTDDMISVYVNPTSASEPAVADVTFSAGNDYGASLNLDRFFFRTNTSAVPTMSVAYPKVSKTYADLFTPVLAVSNNNNIQKSEILQNPVGSELKLKLGNDFDKSFTNIIIRDISGKVVKNVKFQESISVADLTKGNYILSINESSKKQTIKFIKN